MKKYLIACLCLLLPASVQAKLVAQERSLYQTIYVTEGNGLTCMSFRSNKWGTLEQSCIDNNDPLRLVFDYYQGIAYSTGFLDSPPKHILVIGLGGGVVPAFFESLYPNAHIDAVEIDPLVIDIAERYFRFTDKGQITAHAADGRVFAKRAARKNKKYDLIVLDAFNGDYIPEHLMTLEFLEDVKQILSDQGLVVSNTFSDSKLYDHESQTYKEVFGDFYQIQVSNNELNRVIIARKHGMPSIQNIDVDHQLLEAQLKPYGVDASAIRKRLIDKPSWDVSAEPLTDQYSPANLLNE